MANEQTHTDRVISGGYPAVWVSLSDGRLALRAVPGVSDDWIIAALGVVPVGSGRRHGRAELPNGGRAFIKIYNPRAGHSLWRRLRSSRAIAEGRGYLAFAAAGIETPELLAWGEVRRRGLWMRGVVLTRLVDGPTVAEEFAARGDAVVMERAAECLARIHRAGLVHGDPRLRNFLVAGEKILAFDLCSWGRLSERRRREDLVKFLGSARTVTGREVAERLLARYSECAGSHGADVGRLMDDVELYARKERVP